MSDYQLFHGDCLDVMAGMEAQSVDSIVCDPPAGISFMGKKWDGDKGGRNAWIAWMASIAAECLRVLKPGGHAFVWALPRTSHWTATAWEDAGFEVRERVAHIFGSGFPKSLNVGKAIDKAAGAEREVVVVREDFAARAPKNNFDQFSATNPSENGINTRAFAQKKGQITAPATPEAQQWDGWGTALKPAMEDWWLFRKPLAERTVAANVLKWGTGGLNVDACRVEGESGNGHWTNNREVGKNGIYGKFQALPIDNGNNGHAQGRWPANLILSYPEDEYDDEGNLLPTPGKDEVLKGFPESAGQQGDVKGTEPSKPGEANCYGIFGRVASAKRGDTGSAARFFYVAKSSKRDRDEGCEGLEEKGKVFNGQSAQPAGNAAGSVEDKFSTQPAKNFHPCVKPTALMQYLCRLITPPGGLVLDPFMGSGSTGKGAVLEGFRFVGIEQDAEYIEIARPRIEWAFQQAHPTTGEFVTKAGKPDDTDGLPMFGGEQ